MFRARLLIVVTLGAAPAWASPARPEVESALQAVLAVGAEGQGNEAATGAWGVLSRTTPADLGLLFSSLDRATPVQANYLRSAIETALERADPAARQASLPLLGEVLLDRTRSPNGRNLAFELIGTLSPTLRDTLLPGLLDDPSEFLRRDAVQRLLEEAKAAGARGEDPVKRVILLQALHHARDPEQVREISQLLEKLGSPVDLPRHFGFLTHWQVIGPFDNTKREGFARAEPPEQELGFSKSYPGKHGPVAWKPFATGEPFGKVDLNQPLGMEKEVLGYALAEFESDTAREVEFRLGTKNAWKLWLNGALLFERDEYHRGQRIDQYRIKASLRPGKNLILVKCCQDEQVQDWTVEWEFQLRVCDSSGTAVLARNRLPTPPKETVRRRPPPSKAAPPAPVPAPAPTQDKAAATATTAASTLSPTPAPAPQ